MNCISNVLAEAMTTLADLLLPHALTKRILQQTDHFAPHSSTGFEGWYTRIQGEDFSIAIIMCSLAPKEQHFDRQHYLHFSIVPLGNDSIIEEEIQLHLFPETVIPTAITPGQLPFTLDAPGFGVFTCHPDQQTYELSLQDETGDSIYTISVRTYDRVPIDGSNLTKAPHGSFARLESTLPLHWAIFSTSSMAEVSIRRHRLGNKDAAAEVVLEATGRAHMEKNWGVSFPQGWTWYEDVAGRHTNQVANVDQGRRCPPRHRALHQLYHSLLLGA